MQESVSDLTVWVGNVPPMVCKGYESAEKIHRRGRMCLGQSSQAFVRNDSGRIEGHSSIPMKSIHLSKEISLRTYTQQEQYSFEESSTPSSADIHIPSMMHPHAARYQKYPSQNSSTSAPTHHQSDPPTTDPGVTRNNFLVCDENRKPADIRA
ncbi:hypothetical protein BO94DRAFT_535250 [Aspergillus sclerotioniger CBS 115572]|uniref:Uncharacterized protein n=1 Tax=Aspergillus sclerotioniger CBS 115572 TaxID=1450535 RepID=A0A317WL85_9EURO|nr:hypothetical protein BO94DRAFT_535250 [Aspergillus sclerotioniger CBS 115572]PWY87153.1 hypothetical protein BO94DRAFT_535250 [Aspergillus sclerotioniger CBS 115572]